ncbi:hypothetical protein ACFVH6_25780 [Spirillospora sp. NPDC127200]
MAERRIEPEVLAKLLQAGKSHRWIAEQHGMTVAGVADAVARYNLQRPRLSHKWALPWTIRREHASGKIPNYLRYLSGIAQGQQIKEPIVRSAMKWAEECIGRGLDVDYDPHAPPNDDNPLGGFFLKPADPESWHLKKVHDRARLALIKPIK